MHGIAQSKETPVWLLAQGFARRLENFILLAYGVYDWHAWTETDPPPSWRAGLTVINALGCVRRMGRAVAHSSEENPPALRRTVALREAMGQKV